MIRPAAVIHMSVQALVLAALVVFPVRQGAVAAEAASSAIEAVRALYVPTIWNPLELQSFSGVTEPALSILTANAKQTQTSGAVGCLAFVPTIDGEDYDDEEIDKTLKVVDLGAGSEENSRTIAARFTLFQEKREILWTMQRDGEVWKIADIESPASNWRLSKIACGR